MKAQWVTRIGEMSRRRFLALAGLGAATTSLIGLWIRRGNSRILGSVRRSEADDEQARLKAVEGLPLEEAIPRYYNYLKLDREGVLAFVSAYAASSHASDRDHRSRERAMGRYLLSTDFFANRADETRTVRYIAFHDPHISPCVNPFRKV